MSMIPDEIIEQVRDSSDIVGIIGESVELKRTGADYRGPCPFHGGTHRNLAVIPKKNLFYCFVCHASGDIFTYFMKRFGMDYPTAVREVARRSGIVIPEQTSRAGPDPLEPLYSAVSLAQDWFARQLLELPEADAARRYLVGRDLDLETVQPLGLGYAPVGAAFMEAMKKHEVPEPVLLEAGLLHKRDDGRVSPRFRGRLLFPIHDMRGRVVGFGGRILGSGEPKYLNSPETPIFHKGGMLYNLHQAKHAIRKAEAGIVVEGYFDVIRLVLVGIENVVAPLGTAMTADQATLLRRFAPTAILMYDSDAAGQRATFRAGDVLLRHEVRVKVVTMPPGDDPDTLARTGGAAGVEAVLHDAIDLLERKIQLLEQKGWFRDVEHRREALDRLLPTVRAAKDSITRDLYLSLIAERTGVSKSVLEQELSHAPAPIPTPPPPRGVAPSHGAPARNGGRRLGANQERALLRVMVHFDGWIDRARQDVPVEWMEGTDSREIFLALLELGSRDLSLPVLEKMSPSARMLWGEILKPMVEADALAAGDIFEGARQYLEARPHFREYEVFLSRLREASGSEQSTLAAEQSHRLKELRQRFPAAADKFLMGSVGTRLRQPRAGRNPR
ncbi:MAG: DNA primase [Gemmatimonadota bacterium]